MIKETQVIGLTGGSGSGKGYIAGLFKQFYGIDSLDTDAVYHDMTSAGGGAAAGRDGELMEALRSEFGDGVVSPDGSLDRAALGAIVYSSPEKLKKLNSIAHPRIWLATEKWLKAQSGKGARYAIIDAPLLYESRFDVYCDHVIGVIADTPLRVRRIMERDGISEEAALRRISHQPDNKFYRDICDFTIVNDEEHPHPELQIGIIMQKMQIM